MQNNPNIEKAHAEIAKQIRLAKRRMFKAHREGIPLHAARDAFLAEVGDAIFVQDFQLHSHPPKQERERQAQASEASPSRERHDLADAVAEIITNDAVPPRLRDRIVNYVADVDHAENETEETEATDSDEARRSEHQAAWVECEALACECAKDGERHRQTALVTLLVRIAKAKGNARDLAFAAAVAAFKASDFLVESAIRATVEEKGEGG